MDGLAVGGPAWCELRGAELPVGSRLAGLVARAARATRGKCECSVVLGARYVLDNMEDAVSLCF